MLLNKVSDKKKVYKLHNDQLSPRYFWFEVGGIAIGILIAEAILRGLEWLKSLIG